MTDATGRSRIASVTVTVRRPPNRAPVAVADVAAAANGADVTIAALGNDSDPDGDTLRLTSTTAPANGTVTLSGTAVRYTPARGFSGTDTFSYTAGDGRGGLASATVTVSVTVSEPQGNATLSWSIPTTRANGSPIAIAEISGYEISMVAENTGDEQVIEVTGGATTTHTLTGLAPDTYHFSIAARDAEGSLSELSEVASKTISP